MTNVIGIKHAQSIGKLEQAKKLIIEVYEAEGTDNLFVHNALDRAETIIGAVIAELKTK
jgi:hypothetical protein